MKHLTKHLATILLLTAPVFSNSEIRSWKLLNGEALSAEIEKIDEAAKTVLLRKEDTSEVSLQFSELSLLDRAWLLEWIETEEELTDKVAQLGGTLEHYQTQGATTTTDFYVYSPSGTEAEKKTRPLMILFDPSGKGRRYLLRHIEAGEAAKITLIGCDVFRNGMGEANHLTRFEEMLGTIKKNIPHDSKKIFLGGTSGGAARSYMYSAISDQAEWAGIYANGGWLGGREFWNRKYREGMRVAMVNGNNDVAAEQWREADTNVLTKRNITVSLHAFEGGHQVPPPSVQTKAFLWLIGKME